MATKRIGLFSDLHCGHRVGLTPPGWQLRPADDDPKRMKWLNIQTECWNFFQSEVRRLKPFDIAVWNGDLIEGTGYRSGGTELICTDRNQQIDMACKCIQVVNAKKNIFVRGTPYHTGEAEDMEDMIAACFNETAHDHEWLDVNGLIFDLKHHIGGSQVPYGRLASLGREEIWNALWAEAGYTPRADFLVRAHVHFSTGGWRFVGGREVNFLTTPALQAMGTKFGAKRCSGLIDFGFHHLDISKTGEVLKWQKHIVPIESQRTTVRKG